MNADSAQQQSNTFRIASWLLVCALLIFAMVVLGGVTRLTGSGLSMVKWHPIHGVVPPLTAEEWDEEFVHYQQSPEFQKINRDMDVAGFKQIFYFEYAHRMLGRLIGLCFLLPMLYFWWRGQLSGRLKPRMVVLFVLGGLQGLLGWYMVKSGLVDNPHVSQYRLSAHLIAAVLLYSYILWTAFSLLRPPQKTQAEKLSRGYFVTGLALLGMVFITIISGGFVAGLKAGLIFNSFPQMNGYWIPPGLTALDPFYLNLFENRVTVQFNHRLLALTTALLLLIFATRLQRTTQSAAVKTATILLISAVVLQVSLGISTLLLHVPVSLASLHQAGALLVVTALLWLLNCLRAHSTDHNKTSAGIVSAV